METGVPGEKPLQAKLRADYFSLPLFLYLQCLKQKEEIDSFVTVEKSNITTFKNTLAYYDMAKL